MDNLLQDMRYGIRTLMRQPGFAATAILTLALGIGATTAIFSVVNAVVLRPMPFDAPERVMVVTNTNTKTGSAQHHDLRPGLLRLARAEPAVSRRSPYFTGSGETSVTVNNVSDYTTVTRVSPGYLRVFGATARIGRLFTPEEEQPGDSDAIVITEPYWRRQFGSDPRAIGSTITLRPAHAHDHRRHGDCAIRRAPTSTIPIRWRPKASRAPRTTIAASADWRRACRWRRRSPR